MRVDKKRQWGDRRDARRLRDLDSMHAFMPYMLPNRTDNEAFIQETIDLTALNAFIEKKNAAGPEHRYTIFQAIIAALAHTIALRPRMNRYIKGYRVYERDKIMFSFTIKKQFTDDAHEALAFLEFTGEDTIDLVHERMMKEILNCRGDKPDNSTAVMDILTKLPRFMLRLVVGLLNLLDSYDKVPYDVIRTDPYRATVFVSNLGSIKLKAGYHHLANWGTGSIFLTIGEKSKRTIYDEQGVPSVREVLDFGITLDERIADGYYYAGTVRLLKHLLTHPDLLDEAAKEPELT